MTGPGVKFPSESSKSLHRFRVEKRERARELRRNLYPRFYPKEGQLTPEEVLDYLESDPMICLLCGRGLQLLGRHVSMVHDMTVHEYCVRYAIPFWVDGWTGLCTRAQRQRLSKQQKAIPGQTEKMRTLHQLVRTPKGPGDPDRVSAAAKAMRVHRSTTSSRPCLWCEKAFRPSHAAGRFCSKSCSMKARHKDRPVQLKPAGPCRNCGEYYKPLRRGRCNACRLHYAAHGTERPIPTVARRGG